MKNKVYIGWDIGGANTKICVFDSNFNIIRVECININIWSNFKELNNLFDVSMSTMTLASHEP